MKVNLNLSNSPERTNLGKKSSILRAAWPEIWLFCSVPCYIEIWQMTLTNISASLLTNFKLCSSFHRHWWIQTGVTILNLGHNWWFFGPLWTRNSTDDFGKQWGKSPMLLQALCMISKSSVNSNWSYSPEMPKLEYNWCWPPLPWPLTLNFRMDVTFINGNNFWKCDADTMTLRLWKSHDRLGASMPV